MKYIYFVSYTYNGGNGNCNAEISSKINDIDKINDMQKKIEKEFNLKGVIINNFKLLKRKLF